VSEAGRAFRTELGRVRGLGTAKEGVHHWWMQRVSAVALIPLTLWFVIALVAHIGADYTATRAWLGSPITFGLMVLLIGATFYHAQLGLQVVIEDYIHHEGGKIALILMTKLASLVLALAAVVALLVIAFGR
jgi:succinate dehydrogenase / fumarate reductase, membrane anchor subunit